MRPANEHPGTKEHHNYSREEGRAWEQAFNRTQIAENQEREQVLLEAGWLEQPPVFESSATFDKSSLELYPGGKKPAKK